MTDTDYAVVAVTERSDGTYTVQLMEECDPKDDPHGDGAYLETEVTASEAILP